MKKYFMFLLLLLPMFVKADMTNIKFVNSNDNVVVGGDFVISFVVDGYNTPLDNFSFEYDTNFLETFSDMVRIKSKGIVIYGYDNDKFIKNDNVRIDLNGGRLVLSLFNDSFSEVDNVITGDNAIEVSVRFKSLKDGDSFVSLKSNDGFVNTKEKVTILKAVCEEVKCEKEEVKDVKIVEDKEEEIDYSMPFYISIGTNVLLLFTVMILLVRRKKRN